MKDQLVLPLNEKTARERSAEPSGERGVVDPVVHLDKDGLDAHESTEQEEGKGDGGTCRDDDIGSLAPENLPGKAEVLHEIRDVAGGRIVGPVAPLRLEEIMAVWHVERDPEAIVVLPPGLQNQKVREVPT